MTTDSLQDPLLLIFGSTLLKKKWRKVDRELMDIYEGTIDVLDTILKDAEDNLK